MRAILISAAIGYLLGSIPFGYLLVRKFRGADVRTTGSGNIGATNVARTSPALGLLTLVLDALKGGAAVLAVWAIYCMHVFGTDFGGTSSGAARMLGVGLHDPRNLAFVAALAAVAGHIFPVWLRLRGGKGVATGLGAFLLLTPQSILLAMLVFLGVLVWLRRVAIGSISATASLPFFALLLFETHNRVQLALLAASSLLIILQHHKNIGRLLSGTEPKFEMRRH